MSQEPGTRLLLAADACLACGGEERRELYGGLLWQCTRCGFAWAEERDAVVPEEVYSDEYFFGGEYLDYPAEQAALERNFDLYLERLRRHLRGGRLLEVGCAYGYFLARAQRDFSVVGVDVNAQAIAYAREQLGVEAYCGDFQRMDLLEGGFDAVVSFAAIEHFARPDLLVERAAGLLRPGGVFACTTPDLSSWLARLRGSNWRMIHPPTHLSYFTREAMAHLFRRHGLAPAAFESVGQYRTVDNVLYTLLCLHGRGPRLYAALKRLGLARGYFYLNTFDTMFAVGIRPGA